MIFLLTACVNQGFLGSDEPFDPERLNPVDDAFVAEHADWGMHTEIIDGSAHIMLDEQTISLTPLSYGRKRALTPIEKCEPTVDNGRVSTSCGAVAWFEHDSRGLEFGLDIPTRPEGNGPLMYALAFDAPKNPNSEDGVIHFIWGDDHLQLDGLAVIDANGVELDAEMEIDCVNPDEAAWDTPTDRCWLSITADDSNAEYPVVIDPIISRGEDIVLNLVTNCGGTPATHCEISAVEYGDLVITEMMTTPDAIPGGSTGEWFEIYNTTGAYIDLRGMVIHDLGSDIHELDAAQPVIIGPDEYQVIARESKASKNGGISNVLYAYANDITLADLKGQTTADQLRISWRNGTEDCTVDGQCNLIDAVDYDDTWKHVQQLRQQDGTDPSLREFLPESATLSLHPELMTAAETENDARDAWCDSYSTFGTDGQFGTPGAANDSCTFTMWFEFAWDTTGDGVDDYTGCTWLEGYRDGTFITGNGGDGLYVRYTNYFDANRRGQHMQWTYDYTSPPSAGAISHWGLRTYGSTTDDWINTYNVDSDDTDATPWIDQRGTWYSPAYATSCP